MGKARDGGLTKLWEELEAENTGGQIPAEIRWLGGAKVLARFQANKDGSSSVVAVVLGEAAFSRLCKGGVRLLGRRYEVDAFEEAGRPDALCGRAASGGMGILPLATSQLRPPGAPPAQGTTPRATISAQSRGVGWGRATHAHTGRPGVQTAGEPMGRGRMPALSSERPANQPGGGGHHPRHVGRGGLPTRPRLPRRRPRSPREGREWVRRGSRRGKREGRLRLPWRRGSWRLGGSCLFFSFCSLSCPGALSFPFVWRSWGEGGDQGALL